MYCLISRLHDAELVAMNKFEIVSGIERLLIHHRIRRISDSGERIDTSIILREDDHPSARDPNGVSLLQQGTQANGEAD